MQLFSNPIEALILQSRFYFDGKLTSSKAELSTRLVFKPQQLDDTAGSDRYRDL
jgi:hypothetical protein